MENRILLKEEINRTLKLMGLRVLIEGVIEDVGGAIKKVFRQAYSNINISDLESLLKQNIRQIQNLSNLADDVANTIIDIINNPSRWDSLTEPMQKDIYRVMSNIPTVRKYFYNEILMNLNKSNDDLAMAIGTVMARENNSFEDATKSLFLGIDDVTLEIIQKEVKENAERVKKIAIDLTKAENGLNKINDPYLKEEYQKALEKARKLNYGRYKFMTEEEFLAFQKAFSEKLMKGEARRQFARITNQQWFKQLSIGQKIMIASLIIHIGVTDIAEWLAKGIWDKFDEIVNFEDWVETIEALAGVLELTQDNIIDKVVKEKIFPNVTNKQQFLDYYVIHINETKEKAFILSKQTLQIVKYVFKDGLRTITIEDKDRPIKNTDQ
jgi:hypothetical protein